MSDTGAFLDMGGYAMYVWSSFGALAMVLGWNIASPRQRRRQVLRQLAEDADATNHRDGSND